MASLLRYTVTRWNMFLMAFRSGGWWGILNNLPLILSIASWNILRFWEGSPFCRNSFSFWLFSLLEILGNLSLTNCENNSPLMFPSYRKHSITHLSWRMATINVTIHTSSNPFFIALGTTFLMQPFPFISPHTSSWFPCLISLFYQQNKIKNDSKHFLWNYQIFYVTCIILHNLQNANLQTLLENSVLCTSQIKA